MRNRRKKWIGSSRQSLWFSGDVGKEVIHEIQNDYFWKRQPLAKREYLRVKSIDTAVGVSQITGKRKTVKTVKFEQHIEAGISSDTNKGKHDFKELRDFIQGRSMSKTRTNANLIDPSTLKGVQKGSKLSSFINKKITKKAQQSKQSDKFYRKSDYSRPSSVTSIFTACSIGNTAYSHRFGPSNEVMNHVRSESQTFKNDLEREIVLWIEENLFISHPKPVEKPKSRSRSRPRDCISRNMTLISEIQSDLERSQDMSVDEISFTKRLSNIGNYDSDVESDDIYFMKTLSTQSAVQKYTTDKRELSQVKRSFKCYAEPDVVKFTNFKPMKLSYNLTKGDDDEDSDSEDINNGQKYLVLHLEKAIMGLL
jgi:hypothetical protein